MSRDLSSILPASVLVVFQGRRCDGTITDTVPPFYAKNVALNDSGWSLASQGFTGFAGTVHFRDSALALFHVGDLFPYNQSALDALAVQIAKSYYDWHSRAFDLVYNGVVAPEMNGLFDMVEWAYVLGDCHTRILTGPYNADPEELHHNDPANAECQDDPDYGTIVGHEPCQLYYGPPASLSGGMLTLSVYEVCIVDGRLKATYQYDLTAPCACKCNPATSKVCVTVNDNCPGNLPYHGPHAISGVAVTLKNKATSAIIGTCTTNSSGQCCISFTDPVEMNVSVVGDCGSANTDVPATCSPSNINFTLPGANITLAYTSECSTPTGNVVDFSGNNVNDPGLGIQPGGFLGECVPKFGDYTAAFTCTDGCYQDQTDTIHVTSCTQIIPLTLTPARHTLTGTIIGCASLPLDGASWEIDGAGETFSGTTGSDGKFTASLKSKCVYSLTISKNGFSLSFPDDIPMPCNDTSRTWSFAISFFEPTDGYICSSCCNSPVLVGFDPPPSHLDPNPQAYSAFSITDSQGTNKCYTETGAITCNGIRTLCITAPGKTVNCANCTRIGIGSCDSGTFTADIGYFYCLSCGDGNMTLTRYLYACTDAGGNPTTLAASFCSGAGAVNPNVPNNPGSCFDHAFCSDGTLVGEAVTVAYDPLECGPLSLAFNFTFGFGDTATVNG